jgi:PAS domain S-box-containing protein
MRALIKLAALADDEIDAGLGGVLNLLKQEIGTDTICLFSVSSDEDIDLIQYLETSTSDGSALTTHRAQAQAARQAGSTESDLSLVRDGIRSVAAQDVSGDTCMVLTYDVAGPDARNPDIPDAELVQVLLAIRVALRRKPARSSAVYRARDEAVDTVAMGIAIYSTSGQISFCNRPFKETLHAFDAEIETLDTACRKLEEFVLDVVLPSSASHEPKGDKNKIILLPDGVLLDLKINLLPSGSTLMTFANIGDCPKENLRMQAAIDGAGLGTWEWTMSTGRNRINARWAEMLGYSLDELDPVTIESFKSLVHPATLREVNKEWDKVMSGETDSFEVEMQMFHKSGRLAWIKSQGCVTAYGPDGKPAILSGVHLEISDLKLAESRLLNLLEGAHIGTWDWDLIAEEQTGNHQWVEMLGYSWNELAPITYQTWRNFVHPDDIDNVEEGVNRAVRGEMDFLVGEYRMRHKNGSWLWLLDRARVVSRDRNGRAAFVSGIQIDITEQKSREEALRTAKSELERVFHERNTAEMRLADIASVSDDVFWEQDSEMRFQFLSHRKFREMAGQDKIDLVGHTLREWVSDRPQLRASADWDGLLATMDARKPFRDFVSEFYSTEIGEPRWLRISGAPIYDEAGEFQGYRGVGSDVTQLFLAKLNAEEASKSKSIFLANMSHEIRTPLNGVLGMAEVLDNTLVDPAQKKMIRTIRNSGESLLNILNDILDMSKIEARKLELEILPFDPAELAARVEELHHLRADEKGLEFEVSIGMGAQKSRIGDPHRIRQILDNLISNALKFTDAGEVSVSLKGNPGRPFVIEVSDTGIGMSEACTSEILKDFTQADSSITRRFGGTGLGMSITKSLVEMMHGTIAIQSEPGVGTKITVTLPLPVDESVVLPAKPVDVKELCIKGRHVLIADDNPTNCTVLEHLIQQLGATSVVTTNGLEAMQAWEKQDFDLLLLDIAMPVMDGKTALEKIREVEASSGRPYTSAIAVTANVMPYQISEYIEAGFDVTITKPVSAKQICHAAMALLDET